MTPESQAAPPITEPAHGSGSFATGRRRPPNPARPSRSYSAETISKARRKFGRSIPPRDEWPGEEVTEDAVLEASGDPRDWFTYKMRLEAFAYIQEKHWSAWRKIERMGRQLKPIPFGQTLVCGHQGVGKSVLVCCECMRPYMKGYPFFHVGQSWLFGRNLVGPERYEVLRRLPLSSTIAYDEAHNPFDTGLSNSTGVRGWRAQSAGFRKKDARLWLASAKANLVAPTVRNTSTQLWRPLKVNIKNNFLDERPKQHSNPKNFVYVWEEWHNYPLERGDVFDSGQSQGNGAGRRGRGLGPADDVRLYHGEFARLGMLLTDSFMPVEAASAQTFALADAMRAQRASEEGQQADAGSDGALNPEQLTLVRYLYGLFDGDRPPPPRYLPSDHISHRTGIPVNDVRQMMRRFFGHVDRLNGPNGYNTALLEDALQDTFFIAE